MKKLFVSDITLRVAGENLQRTLTFREKLNIAGLLEKAGVDSIELPLLTDNKEDTVIFNTIAQSLTKSVVCIPCDSEESINIACECMKNIKNVVLQISLPISTVQMEYMYHVKAPKMLDKIAALCKAAKQTGYDVEFVARDATRADIKFAVECCKTACENGASAITICDDCGDSLADEFCLIAKEIKNACNVNVYVQTSDKLNMATACAVEAIKVGIDGVKTSAIGDEYMMINAFAEVIRSKGDHLNVNTNLDITSIYNIVSTICDTDCGDNSSGVAVADTMVIESNSSLADVSSQIISMGYELSADDIGNVYEEFKRVSSKKGSISLRELEAIIASSAMQVPSTYHLINYVVNSGNIINSTASITLEKNGETLIGVSVGDGPIDAAFHAIEQIIGFHYELDDFQIQSITKGREALGSSIIKLRANGKLYPGNGISTDIIGACIRAYINALNKIVYGEN